MPTAGTPGEIQPASLSGGYIKLLVLIKKVKLWNKDAAAYASGDSPRLPLLWGWCPALLASNADKLQRESKKTWKPRDLPLPRARG